MNIADYNTFLDALSFDPSDRVCLGFSSGKGDWQNVFHTFAELSTPQVIQEITARNNAGKNVYISMAPFASGSVQRTKENVQAIRHVFIEKDENAAETLAQIEADVKAGIIPQPTIILESSPDKLQVIWTVNPDDFLLPDGKPDIAKHEIEIDALQYRYQSDPASTDSARVLRIAGTVNHKYEAAPSVKLLNTAVFPVLYRSDDFHIDQKPVTSSTPAAGEAAPIIPGSRNKTLTSIAGTFRNVGLSADGILDELHRINEERCVPPLPEDEVETIARSVSRYVQGDPGPQVLFSGQPGKNTLSDDADDLSEHERESLQDKLKSAVEMALDFASGAARNFVLLGNAVKQAEIAVAAATWRDSFRAIGQMEQGAIRMLIDGILPEGVTYIGGLSAGGKTWFALSIVKALTTGEPFLGKYLVPQRVPVLYLIPEVGDRAFRSRLDKFKIPNDENFFLCRTISMGATLRLSDPITLEAVKQMKPVVFLDTSIRFSTSDDENSATQNKMLVDDIINLRANGAISIVGLHHATKAMGKEEMT